MKNIGQLMKQDWARLEGRWDDPERWGGPSRHSSSSVSDSLCTHTCREPTRVLPDARTFPKLSGPVLKGQPGVLIMNVAAWVT